MLSNNYRSTQPILDISTTLINRNEDRLVKQLPSLVKQLISSNERINQLTHPPLIREYENQQQEMIGITLQIEELINNGTPPGRIGVIYRENKYGEELTKYFQLRNIPVYSKRRLNIFNMPLAQKIILVFRWLAAEHDIPYGGDEMLFEILHIDWFNIPAVEIAKLSIEVADRKFGDTKTSMRQLLSEKANEPPKDLFSPSLHDGLKKASIILESLISDVPNVTLQSLFENIIRKAGVLNQIMQSPDKLWLMQVLTGLFDFVKEETRRQPLMTLQHLVNIFDLMEHEEIPLPLVQVSGSDKGVNLLTAHGAKGLEFESVFFAGCNASWWEKKRKPGGGYAMPDTIFSTSASNEKGKVEVEELRRLFYVALTRAEQHLFISYSRYKNDGKDLEPSMFIAEIQDIHPGLNAEQALISAMDIFTFSSLQFISAAPEIEKIEEAHASRLLEKFSMNVTALNNYLKCPLEFYFKNLLRIPSPKNEATEFGSSVHYALEQLFRKMQASGNEQFPSKQEFITDFEWFMHRHRESFTNEQFERRLEYGHEVLGNYYDSYIYSFNKIVAIERNIRNVIVRDVPLKGKLDKLEFDGKSVNVVDYKTGDPDKALSKLKGPHDKDPNGGDYWRQAVFYKILVDNYNVKDWKVVSTEFDFIEPDKKKSYRKAKLNITAADITTVTEQIKDTWKKIQAHDFYTGCGKEDCHWCNFVKTNNLAIALHEIEEEQEEEL